MLSDSYLYRKSTSSNAHSIAPSHGTHGNAVVLIRLASYGIHITIALAGGTKYSFFCHPQTLKMMSLLRSIASLSLDKAASDLISLLLPKFLFKPGICDRRTRQGVSYVLPSSPSAPSPHPVQHVDHHPYLPIRSMQPLADHYSAQTPLFFLIAGAKSFKTRRCPCFTSRSLHHGNHPTSFFSRLLPNGTLPRDHSLLHKRQITTRISHSISTLSPPHLQYSTPT